MTLVIWINISVGDCVKRIMRVLFSGVIALAVFGVAYFYPSSLAPDSNIKKDIQPTKKIVEVKLKEIKKEILVQTAHADLSGIIAAEQKFKQDYDSMPLKDLKTKRNADGTVEIRGILLSSHMTSLLRKGSSGDATVIAVMDLLNTINDELSFYIKGKIVRIGSETYLNVSEAKVNGWDVPWFLIRGQKKVLPPYSNIEF